jgi:hypothetical protein
MKITGMLSQQIATARAFLGKAVSKTVLGHRQAFD